MDGAYDKEAAFKFIKEKGVNMQGIKNQKEYDRQSRLRKSRDALEFTK